jgi:dihydrofolate synthase/folylpolyglutamate synthase
MNFSEATEYLNSRVMFGIKLGLDNVSEILKLLNNPQDELNFIHLAGTNGKGSTASLLNAGLINADAKVGLFTSPHLISVRERIRINGEAVSETIFAEEMTKLSEGVKDYPELQPTYFETTALLAILVFKRLNCDFVIWETGMGGRLDATNVVTPVITAIINCALDHCAYLGETIEEIASEKGGIIKPGVPIFYGGNNEVVRHVLLQIASEKAAPFNFRGNDFFIHNYDFTENGMTTEIGFQTGENIQVETKLWGRHQADNVSLAAVILRYLSFITDLNFGRMLTGMNNAQWPGRLQQLDVFTDTLTFVDGAHNAHAAQGLVNSLNHRFKHKKWHVLIGILEDKDCEEFLKIIDKSAASYTILPVNNPRTAKPEQLKQTINAIAPEKSVNIGSIADIKSYLKNDTIITGSLYLIGDILKELTTEEIPSVLTN